MSAGHHHDQLSAHGRGDSHYAHRSPQARGNALAIAVALTFGYALVAHDSLERVARFFVDEMPVSASQPRVPIEALLLHVSILQVGQHARQDMPRIHCIQHGRLKVQRPIREADDEVAAFFARQLLALVEWINVMHATLIVMPDDKMSRQPHTFHLQANAPGDLHPRHPPLRRPRFRSTPFPARVEAAKKAAAGSGASPSP